MKKFVLALVLFLAGCSTQPKIVYLPVSSCPAPKISPEPQWPTLSKNANAPEFVKFCVVDYRMCHSELESCRRQLGVYSNGSI